jgi:hypothetical protein
MSKDTWNNSVLEGPFRHAVRIDGGMLVLRFRTEDGHWGSIVRSADGKPSRAVKPGWQQRSTYRLASKKSIGVGEAESGLEADAFRMFDFDRAVNSYKTQPFTVIHETGGRTISTYPDVELRYTDGKFEVVQIKTQKTYEKHLRENPRFRAEPEIFRTLGWSYRVLTEAQIRAEPMYSNRKLLRHYRNRPVAATTVAAIVATLRRYAGATICDVVDAFREDRLHHVDIYALIARHEIRADIAVPIGPTTRLIPPV